MTGCMVGVLRTLFGLMLVIGVGVMGVALLVQGSTSLALVGGFTTLMGLLGFHWLGE